MSKAPYYGLGCIHRVGPQLFIICAVWLAYWFLPAAFGEVFVLPTGDWFLLSSVLLPFAVALTAIFALSASTKTVDVSIMFAVFSILGFWHGVVWGAALLASAFACFVGTYLCYRGATPAASAQR